MSLSLLLKLYPYYFAQEEQLHHSFGPVFLISRCRFTDKCAIACAEKEKAWHAFRKDPSDENKQRYSQAKLDAQAVFAQARSQYTTSIKNKLAESGSNSKAWWRIVNHVCGKGGQTEIPSFHQNGQLFETAAEKAEILKDIFVSKSCLNDEGKNPTLLPNFAHASLNAIKIRTKVVEKKLKQLKSSKATGPDEIPARVLKECAAVLSKPLTRLFNMSLHQGIVPTEWKCAQVIPCHKSGAKSDPNNYLGPQLMSFGI